MSNLDKQLTEVSKKDPCIHCGKGDWCYRFANGASVCNRQNIAQGWEESGKFDKNGAAILYPVEWGKKRPEPKVISETDWIYQDRQGNDLVKVIRKNLDDGEKKIYQNYWNGKRWLMKKPAHINRSDIPIYKYQEISDAIQKQETIFIVEGEKCADKLWSMGLPATTNIQGAQSFSRSDLQDLAGVNKVVLVPDRDRPGVDLMKQWEAALKNAGVEYEWLYPYGLSDWKNIPERKGLDIFDWIRDGDLTKDEVLEAIGVIPNSLKVEVKTTQPLAAPNEYSEGSGMTEIKESDSPRSDDPEFPHHVKAVYEIFGTRKIIAIDSYIYEWNGKFYERLDPAAILSDFKNYAENTPIYDPRTQREKYSLLTPRFLNLCVEWLAMSYSVSADSLNPSGINLANGVLRFTFKGRQVSWKLEKHSPADYFLYCSDVAFNPDADPTQALNLLAALDPAPRTVFLRTVAAAVDLPHARSILGRGIRAAICRGSGANGKDSLKEAITLIFGDQNIASCTFGDFKAYDSGRKFDLVSLRGTRFNWPSENNQQNTLDLSESMNAAITGDRGLVFERKGKDGEPFICNAVHLFNCNQLPKIKSGLDSLTSRFCVLDFFKTFKSNPDPMRGELQADPRFKYDPQFMAAEVCPALLNLILAELPLLLAEGIDYDAIAGSLDDVQEESTHLWEFCKDYAISPDPNGRIYVHELWYHLQVWYEGNGTLERIDKPDGGYKNVWHEQANKFDVNITGPNQIFKRFKQLFPKIDRGKENQIQEYRGRSYISGLSLNSASCGSFPLESGVSASSLPRFSLVSASSDSNGGNSFTSQNTSQNGFSNNPETIDISAHEPHEAKNQKVSEKKLQEKLTKEEIAQFKGMANDFKEVLGWDSAKMTQFAKENFGKGAINHLTMGEASQLIELLTHEVVKLG